MIKTKAMTKVRISGPKNVQKEVIDTLYDLELLHLVQFDKEGQDFFDIGTPFNEADEYSKLLLRLRAMIDYLEITGEPEKIKNINSAINEFEKTEKKFIELSTKEKELTEKISRLKTEEEHPLLSLKLGKQALRNYNSLAVFRGTALKGISEKLKQEKNTIVYSADIGKKEAIAVFVPLNEQEKFSDILKDFSFSEEKVPERTIDEISKDKRLAEQELIKTQDSLAEIKTGYANLLLSLENELNHLTKKAEAPLNFASSKTAFIINGWIPSKDLEKVKSSLGEKTKSKIYIEEFEEKDEAPIELDNPNALKPFEFFLNLYALPQYYELDPSFLIAFTFPFFFGFMLGDVGYGLIVLAAFWLVKKKFKNSTEMQSLATILMLAAVSSTIFGFVYGEAFGIGLGYTPLIHRVAEIDFMLMLTIGIGVLHVNLGFILGFYNKLIHHGFKHALFEKGSWIIIEIGAAIFAMDAMGMMPGVGLIGGIVSIAGLAMLWKGEGINGMVELPGLLSNILSYARLFAIGLASVQLALIVNQLAGQAIAGGILMWPIALLVLFVGHGLNIFLGVLGPFIQSLRLHYVEFFTKFYTGGGQKYLPFGKIGG